MRVAELANPSRFLLAANLAIPWLGGATVLLFAFALYRAMLAPDDYQQGATVKIMFLHVPSACLGMLCWALMTVAALGTLVWRHPLADVAAKAAAPLGAAFTLLCLVTGSLWGRPEWGTYWVWDARLTSELILFLLYLSVIALWRTVEDASRAAREVLELEPARLVFYNLMNNEAVESTRDAKSLAAAKARIAEVADQIRAREFSPKRGFGCGFCDYRPLCPEHEQLITIQAAPPRN